MAEESRAFADPVTRSLIAPVRVGPGYREALVRLRDFEVRVELVDERRAHDRMCGCDIYEEETASDES